MRNKWARRFSTLWKCPTCHKLKRTLGRSRDDDSPPVCLHTFTPYADFVLARMTKKD